MASFAAVSDADLASLRRFLNLASLAYKVTDAAGTSELRRQLLRGHGHSLES